MNPKQALEIIKAILDLSTQKGIFVKMDEAYTAITAFNIISEKIKDQKDNAESN